MLVDNESWESLRELAGALRRRGVDVVRVAPVVPERVTTRALDRAVFGPTRRTAGAFTADDAATRALRAELLAAPTADVHGHEPVLAALAGTAEWRANARLRKVRPDLDTGLLYDKLAVTRFAESVGVAVPASWEEPRSGEFPVMVKGRAGNGGRVVRLARTPAELDAIVAELTALVPAGVFLQRYHPGPVTSSGGVADGGRVLSLGVWHVFPAAGDPFGPPARIEITRDPALAAATRRLIEGLGYSGFFNLNFVRAADGAPLLIDLNCRVFGSWQAVDQAGLPIVDSYVAFLEGRGETFSAVPPAGTRSELVRVPYVTGRDLREVGRSATAYGRLAWSRRRVLGAPWVAATEVRLAHRALAEARRVARRPAQPTTDVQPTPSSPSSERSSGSDSPTTFDGSPSTPATNGPDRPSRVNAPATASGSPVPTYQDSSSSSGVPNRTVVDATAPVSIDLSDARTRTSQ